MRTSLVIAGLALAAAGCGPSPDKAANHSHREQYDEKRRTADAEIAEHRREFESENRRRRADLEKLEAAQRELRAKIEEQNREIEAGRAKLSEAEASREASPPRASRPDDPPGTIRGVVQACNNKVDIVVVSVGKHDGVNEGTEFEVTRDGKPVATIVVDKVFPNYAGGSLKPGTPKTLIQAGDVCVGRARTETPK
jgi:hypothetical protein